jgi:adenine-specific DNA-methyltransferase
MTELTFKGKEFVYNHHLSVPFRPLVPHAGKGIGEVNLDGNLIIQGDNLNALKALLPRYAGKVDCIFIDPPYNTGNEGWAYNDNVNAPMIKEWLAANPIGVEDGLRHDKWCAMMWPRLKLLHELLAEDGMIFISIDEHEAQRLECLLEEIFGSQANLGRIIVQMNPKGRHLDAFFAKTHEYVLAFAKNIESVNIGGVAKDDRMLSDYNEKDVDGVFRFIELRNRNSAFNPITRAGLYFPLYINPKSGSVSLKQDDQHIFEALPLDSQNNPTCWTWSPPKIEREGNLLVGGQTREGKWRVFRKDYLMRDGEEVTTKPKTLWISSELNMDASRKTLEAIIGKDVFDFPKPLPLVQRLIELVNNPNALILDSFAGSGTTAHAVLEANRRDGGNRKFILVEMEDYADRLTAERVRRVINGYAFTGTQKTELLRESLNWRVLQKAGDLVQKVSAIENLHSHEYDKITKQVKDGELIVTGEKVVAERTEGLGGTFTYCTLGEPVELDAILTGQRLPAYEALGGVLYHTATNCTLDAKAIKPDEFYLGCQGERHVWLIYRPDVNWLKGPEAALTLGFARKLAADYPGRDHLVFAASRFVSDKLLKVEGLRVEFVPLPFALYRIEQG